MKFELFLNCIKGYFLLSLILWGCTGYVYYVNSKRVSDSPLKKDMPFAATFLTPFWPVFAIVWVIIFMFRAVLYIFILILFTIGLVIIRKPFILIWLSKVATRIGNKLMKANMFLFRILFPQQKPQTTE